MFTYFILGYAFVALICTRRYGKKLDKLEEQLTKERGLEFGMWKPLGWLGLMFIGWPFVLRYEHKTDFQQWKYPYCDADAMQSIRSTNSAVQNISSRRFS